jgi:hypothetical protein
MPTRYPEHAPLPAPRVSADEIGASICQALVQHRGSRGVSWITAHREPDSRPSYRIHHVRAVPGAGAGRVAVTRVIEVQVLRPYFFK